ncbi:MAG: tRNA (adenosine(37)-N6)-threonylcarbamoyltransferase complex dimerization subunit type 1 TsaB [Desulfobacterales bacterium]|nr:tRNA (adenosine(37)-N6)-threonylcarbamoyltransferase complex dimerization subunit type 1 TsaB [Desulfobacterales bacterium]
MIVLGLSTAEQGGSLAIVDGDRLICQEFWDTKQTHSKRLLGMIRHMVENRSGLDLADIDAYVAARGPGSFTGLRIGISAIKGLAYAMGKPALGASSLDGIAFRFAYSSLPVCVMMDAKRDEVYAAVYRFEKGMMVSKSTERVIAPGKVVAEMPASTLYAGSGSKAYLSAIEEKAETPVIAHPYMDSVCAVSLIRSLGKGNTDLNPAESPLEPVYIRKSDAELNSALKD